METPTMETPTMAAKKKTTLGFELTCPRCGEQSSLCIDLNDLAGEVECRGCDSSFTVAEAIAELGESLRRWQAVQRWIDLSGECLATPATPSTSE
jgi:transcription elongation factor Elf1